LLTFPEAIGGPEVVIGCPKPVVGCSFSKKGASSFAPSLTIGATAFTNSS